MSRHYLKVLDWDVKHHHKQTFEPIVATSINTSKPFLASGDLSSVEILAISLDPAQGRQHVRADLDPNFLTHRR